MVCHDISAYHISCPRICLLFITTNHTCSIGKSYLSRTWTCPLNSYILSIIFTCTCLRNTFLYHKILWGSIIFQHLSFSHTLFFVCFCFYIKHPAISRDLEPVNRSCSFIQGFKDGMFRLVSGLLEWVTTKSVAFFINMTTDALITITSWMVEWCISIQNQLRQTAMHSWLQHDW